MDGVRIAVGAPGALGPTGPSMVAVIPVPTGGTYVNLTEAAFAPLKDAIDRQVPLMMALEGGPNVAYRYGIQGSGPRVDPSAHVFGPTAANQAGMMFGNTRLPAPEIAPQGANGLALQSYGAVGTALLRIWRTG